jgi:hypothetical protein
MDETPQPPAKEPLSEAQLAARRANAQKSTGPKNTSISRFNNLQHGMRARTKVLPGESQEEYDHRTETWMKDLAPENDAQRFVVRRLVDLSWKLKRGDAVEKALARKLISEVEHEATVRQEDEVRLLVEKLPSEPASVARQLRRTVAGCEWILRELATIRQHLETHPWLFHHRRVRLLNMLGKKPQDAITADPVAVRWGPGLLSWSPGHPERRGTCESEAV